MTDLSRRQMLAAAAGAGALAAFPFKIPFALAQASPRDLAVVTRTLDIAGRPAKVLGFDVPGGLVVAPGEPFRIALRNRLAEPTIVHWHGQTPPEAQDGVVLGGQAPLAPGENRAYDFAARPGTHWMHSHFALQEMRLLAAPLIVHGPEDRRADRQEVVVLLQDYSFRDPEEILAGLGVADAHGHGGAAPSPAAPAQPASFMDRMMAMMRGMAGGGSGHAGHGMSGGGMMGGMSGMTHDLNDIEFDAYLANDRTLDDPEVVRVETGGRVLLRVINGASATVFHLDTGALDGELVAVDGNPIVPVTGRRFGLAMGQRADILLRLPAGEGAWPILALREGDRQRAGLVLATAGGQVAKIAPVGEETAPALGLDLEQRLRAARPLAARRVDRRLGLTLTGSMTPYVWSLNGEVWGDHRPMTVKAGERVEIVMRNMSMMAHPMHLHGHHVQVTAIGGRPLAGALRDTVHVPPMAEVTVAFDADNAGRWLIHCHNLPHMAAGMMAEIRYES